MSPYTFTATGEICSYQGAKPVFVDILEDTFNIDPDLIESKITEKTKAIIPVHIAGFPCDMDRIRNITRKYNIVVIEDAAHALGAQYKNKKIGSISDFTAFSFYSTKNITTGEGGMITTNDESYLDKLKILRLHGLSKDAWGRYQIGGSWFYKIDEHGFKYNPSDILSALGLSQLNRIKSMQEKRKYLFDLYNSKLSSLEEVILPPVSDEIVHGYNLYILRLKTHLLSITRNQFIEELKKVGIGCSVHFIPLHLQHVYQKSYGYNPGDYPLAEKVFNEVISLPIYLDLKDDEIHYITQKIIKIILNHKKSISV
jgi:dTDP-4-amino-4,6-dideoxygalactose transaminase